MPFKVVNTLTNTGFYRVSKKRTKSGGIYYRYQIHNKLVDKELTRTDIFELKQAVEDCGFLWGIIDIPLANENKQIYNLETLQGRYGLKINE